MLQQKSKKWRWLLGLLVLIIIAGVSYIQYGLHRSYPIPQGAPNLSLESQIERGRYVATASDCVACHTANSGNFAGGLILETPFGNIASSNITSDKETGIGSWTLADFDKAVRHGIGSHGYLYPGMPYPAYTKISDEDVVNLWAYIQTIPAIHNEVVENQLPFPFNQRWLLAGWNLLFFKDARFTATNDQSIDIARNDLVSSERGQYLVDSMGHCGTCHTPKNLFGADHHSQYLQGEELQGWFASNLTSNTHNGLGKWSEADIMDYLHTGSNAREVASGPMTEAVRDSLQYLTESDLQSIAVYLKSLPADTTQVPTPINATNPQMIVGKKVYETQCIACHTSDGSGVRNMITSFRSSSNVNSVNPASLIHVVLVGEDGPVTLANPTGAGMPGFDWKLSDENIADVLTYIRNSWGNSGSAVTAKEIAEARESLGARVFVLDTQ